MTATLLVSLALFLRASQAFLDAHRLDGSWHSYSTCDLFLAPEPEPTGAPHSVTCSFKLLNVTSNEIWGQSLACTGGPSTHGKDYVYVELAQDGSVVTRIPGVHSKHGAYKFSGWSLVEPGTYDAVIVMGATATADFLTGATADALRQDYLWQTKALINDTVVALQQTQLTKEPVAVDSSAAAAQEARGRPACADGARWKGQWRRIPNNSTGCPPGVCRGIPLKVLQLDSTANRDMGFSHVYAPWQCGPYTLYDGPACLAGKRITFIGNSRTYQLKEYVKAHLGLPNDSKYEDIWGHAMPAAGDGRVAGPEQTYSHHHHRHHTRTQFRAEASSGSSGTGQASGGSGSSSSGGGSSEGSHVHGPERLLHTRVHGDASGTEVNWIELQPYRMGLRQVLATVNLTELLMHNDFVFINSILHDIVNFKELSALEVAQSLGRWSYRTGPPTVGTTMCASTNVSEARRHKYQPVQQFEEALRGFTTELQRARAAIMAAAAAQRAQQHAGSAATTTTIAATTPSGTIRNRRLRHHASSSAPKPIPDTQQHAAPIRMGRLVWLMHGYRPVALPHPCFPNSPERMLCLQHVVLRELGRVGVEVVDLATMQMDSPVQWFWDAVHIAGAGGVKRWGSGLELMAVQVLLNSVCGPGAEGA